MPLGGVHARATVHLNAIQDEMLRRVLLRRPGTLLLLALVTLSGSACSTRPQPDSGIVGTFFVADTRGSIPTPFPTAPPWRGVNGEVAPGPGTLTIKSPNGKPTTVGVDGQFRVPLVSGHYSVSGVTGDGAWGMWGPTDVIVRRHAFTSVRVVVIGSEYP
jgi:hypothetical protein